MCVGLRFSFSSKLSLFFHCYFTTSHYHSFSLSPALALAHRTSYCSFFSHFCRYPSHIPHPTEYCHNPSVTVTAHITSHPFLFSLSRLLSFLHNIETFLSYSIHSHLHHSSTTHTLTPHPHSLAHSLTHSLSPAYPYIHLNHLHIF